VAVFAGEEKVVAPANNIHAPISRISDCDDKRFCAWSLHLYAVLGRLGGKEGRFRIMSFPDKNKVTYFCFFTSLVVTFFSGGGLFVTILEEHVQPILYDCAILGTVAIAGCLGAFLSCRRLLKNTFEGDKPGTPRYKHIAFSLVLFCVLFASTLILMNLVASFFVPPWPMSGLHGVPPEIGKKAWGFYEKTDGFVRVNSWGQRDREHTIQPQTGVYRVLFIGDSLLEDGAPVPLPFKTEEILKGAGHLKTEMINLGVTATDPDEYFFRLKRVGLPLQPDHCVMMFSAGTDFIQEPTLLSYGGISATYPRWSFLQILGLTSLDHVISNERRQVLRAWFKGGPLLKHELELQGIFGKNANDDEMEKEYLSFFPAEEQSLLKSVLSRSSASDRNKLFSMLRNPDGGFFRSYYLDIATKVAKGLRAPEFTSAEYSFRWVKTAAGLCREKGVRFTLVVIPDGFTVDSRMAGYYAAIADMKAYMKHKDDATNRFVSHAVEAGMDVIDLRELLSKTPGAYNNMDGHWSQHGVDTVARYLAARFTSARTGRDAR
jgi:hypothetical protein